MFSQLESDFDGNTSEDISLYHQYVYGQTSQMTFSAYEINDSHSSQISTGILESFKAGS